MPQKQTKQEAKEYDIASRIIQVAGIIGAVSVVIFAPETADQLTVRIVAGLLGGVALGARPEDAKDIFGAIFGFRSRDK